ncbi:hypothetical protein NST48_14335 [Paenibacillus sp. FSL M7-0547]|uniref:hypothetical protein n=1 Tax=Paenibacillus sp. FSL M7-0547 TaxID=2954755 RepID=UPI0030FCE51A
MSIWSEAPRIQAPPTDPAALPAYVKDLANTTAKMAKDLEFILNGNIAFDNVRAESIETQNLKAGAVTAEKITVEELSAISANLGHITAGLIESIKIYGSYIATRKTGYPKAELNDNGDLVAVWTDAENYVTIEPGLFNEPTMVYRRAGAVSLILGPVSGFTALLATLDLRIGTQSGSLVLTCGSGPLDSVSVPSWSKTRSVEEGQSLATELSSKATSGVSTGSGGGANAGIPIGTKLAVDGGGYVVWNGVPSHSHTQN